MYRVPAGTDWYVEEHYGCCMAISMADAQNHLRGTPRREIVRVRLGYEGCMAAEHGSQEYRKKLFDDAVAARGGFTLGKP